MKRLIFLLFLYVGMGGYAQKISSVNPTIKVELSISKLPVINEVFQVTSKITPEIDLSDTSIIISKIILPDSVKLISGDLELKLKLLKGESFSHKIKVIFIETGNFMIKSNAGAINVGGGRDEMPLNIGKRKSRYGYKLPRHFEESKIVH